jgi:putative hydrolase of the HAD superfamily
LRALDTVLFDLDDTLHDDSRAYKAAALRVAQDVARTHAVDPQQLLRAYVAQASAFWKALSAQHLAAGIIDTRAQMWNDALREVGVDDFALAQTCATQYAAYRSEELVLLPGADELVVSLRERGCKVGIVTNGFAATHHEKIARLGLTAKVDAVFLADEMGMVKPDPNIFVHACSVLGTTPERTAMVGDRYDRDVAGAHEAGLFTVLIDVHKIPLPAGAVPPDATVQNVADVLAVLPLARPKGAGEQVQNRRS